jgi:hypothetical protein
VLAAVCGSQDVPHAGASRFLVVAAIVVGRGCHPLRTLLAPLLAALGTLLGVMDGGVERPLLAAARGHLPAAWGQAKFGRLIAGGVLDGDATQLLSGVPENVASSLEGWRLLCVTPAASRHLRTWPLGS